MKTTSSWLEIDVLGLRRTLERKGMAWAIFELVQNAWDADGTTEVNVTLTKPKNGISILRCEDNAPDGYRNMDEAHTLFASSSKKADPTKRGRFNAGEKYVLVMCESAKVTSTTGQIVFLENGKRKETDITTDAGTIFEGQLQMTDKEWSEVGAKVRLLFPPVLTTYNGEALPQRVPAKTFKSVLATEIANDRGVLTPRKRNTEVQVHRPLMGEMPYIYERGIPVVEHEGKWHISVEQKIPLNMDRDNVTPGYLRNLHATVLEQMVDEISEEDAVKPWAREAVETGKLSREALGKISTKRFGENAVLFDHGDVGSNKEATSKGANVIGRGNLSKRERELYYGKKGFGVLKKAGEIAEYQTDTDSTEAKGLVKPENYTTDQKKFVQLVTVLSPILINHTVTVKIVKDRTVDYLACTRWHKGTYEFEYNLGFNNISDWEENYRLIIHELAHHKVQCNDHLNEKFYKTAIKLGAKLMVLTLERPKLFPAGASKAMLKAA